MSENELHVPANEEAVDVNVSGPEDFKSAADYDEYLSENWLAVIIHNLFIIADGLKNLNDKMKVLQERFDEYTGCDYNFDYEEHESKFYGH